MAATYAVVNIGPPAKAAVPILREHLRNVDPKRIAYNIPAVLALGSIGKDARDAIPDLLRFRDHEASQVREDVQKALSQIDPDNYPPQAAK
jgi:HEAT repeat protein